MNIKTRQELIKEYIDFFKSKNHRIVPNESLVPKEDPTVLFTTAGMHPLIPYLLGQKHPLGKRLVGNQKCIRTQDIEEVGDEFHLTFFEMLGNWSLGDYFKKDAIKYSFEFLTKKLELPADKLKITCFKGDKNSPKDREAAEIWKSLGIKPSQIEFLGKDENWWGPAGKTGPCGPDTEIFYKRKVDRKSPDCLASEIWNNVFMQYNKTKSGKFIELKQKNVDTGMGVERTLAILQNKNSVYETNVFFPIIEQIEKISKKKYGKNPLETRAMRIIADHIKASVFILAEKIGPSNKEQGYVLRRLIRRAVRYGKTIMMQNNFTRQLAEIVISIYPDYIHLKQNKSFILEEIKKEEERFRQGLSSGLKITEKIFNEKVPIKKEKFNKLMQNPDKTLLIGRIFDLKRRKKDYSLKSPKISEAEINRATITGKEAFLLFQSYGFPLETVDELAMERGFLVDHKEFRKEQEKHQNLSRTASKGRFKSGLADTGEQTAKLHTATHLLLAALRKIIDKKIEQRGSNITSERLRFDFNFSRKLTEDELKKIQEEVNKNIKEGLEVKKEEMPVQEAKSSGAMGIFDEKYRGKVLVYSIKDKKGGIISKEICAGPHVKNTKELGKFRIIKEESSGMGVRRIKAILE